MSTWTKLIYIYAITILVSALIATFVMVISMLVKENADVRQERAGLAQKTERDLAVRKTGLELNKQQKKLENELLDNQLEVTRQTGILLPKEEALWHLKAEGNKSLYTVALNHWMATCKTSPSPVCSNVNSYGLYRYFDLQRDFNNQLVFPPLQISAPKTSPLFNTKQYQNKSKFISILLKSEHLKQRIQANNARLSYLNKFDAVFPSRDFDEINSEEKIIDFYEDRDETGMLWGFATLGLVLITGGIIVFALVSYVVEVRRIIKIPPREAVLEAEVENDASMLIRLPAAIRFSHTGHEMLENKELSQWTTWLEAQDVKAITEHEHHRKIFDKMVSRLVRTSEERIASHADFASVELQHQTRSDMVQNLITSLRTLPVSQLSWSEEKEYYSIKLSFGKGWLDHEKDAGLFIGVPKKSQQPLGLTLLENGESFYIFTTSDDKALNTGQVVEAEILAKLLPIYQSFMNGRYNQFAKLIDSLLMTNVSPKDEEDVVELKENKWLELTQTLLTVTAENVVSKVEELERKDLFVKQTAEKLAIASRELSKIDPTEVTEKFARAHRWQRQLEEAYDLAPIEEVTLAPNSDGKMTLKMILSARNTRATNGQIYKLPAMRVCVQLIIAQNQLSLPSNTANSITCWDPKEANKSVAHPHVNSLNDSRSCLGEASDPALKALANDDLFSLIQILVNWSGNVTNDDLHQERLIKWCPLMPDDTPLGVVDSNKFPKVKRETELVTADE